MVLSNQRKEPNRRAEKMARVMYGQYGYVGCSMSARAQEAYERGEMPKSKWTKTAMLEAIAGILWFDDLDEEYINAFKEFKKDELFDRFFEWSSWHHTGKFANVTDFYDVGETAILDFLEGK